MMQWPDGWREAALREIGVPVTQHALDVLNAWEQSTPTKPWTNNPLGLRHGRRGSVKVFDTELAAFQSHADFRAELKRVAHSTYGKPLIHALLDEGDLAGAWRVIHDLNLPSNLTETDYPSALMDMVEGKYRSNIGGDSSGSRKSHGPGRDAPNPHHPVQKLSVATRKATADVIDLRKALDNLMKGLS